MINLLFFSFSFYASQKKTLELNPGHPLVRELLKRVSSDDKDKTAGDLARVLFETATLRSGYSIKVSCLHDKTFNKVCVL